MKYYDMQFDSEKNRIIIKYYEVIYYRTLLQSLEDLYDIGMLERIGLVLDFSEIKALYVGYHQLINFRQVLRSLRSKKKVSNIAIINTKQYSLLNSVCSTVPIFENDLLNAPFSCITLDNTTDANQWLNHCLT